MWVVVKETRDGYKRRLSGKRLCLRGLDESAQWPKVTLVSQRPSPLLLSLVLITPKEGPTDD